MVSVIDTSRRYSASTSIDVDRFMTCFIFREHMCSTKILRAFREPMAAIQRREMTDWLGHWDQSDGLWSTHRTNDGDIVRSPRRNSGALEEGLLPLNANNSNHVEEDLEKDLALCGVAMIHEPMQECRPAEVFDLG